MNNKSWIGKTIEALFNKLYAPYCERVEKVFGKNSHMEIFLTILPVVLLFPIGIGFCLYLIIASSMGM